jgi:hypothetical protein
MKKRRIDNSYMVGNVRYVTCSKCGREVKDVGEGTISAICSYCLVRMVPLEENKSAYKPTGRPPGWHWMKEFVDKDGNVFHRGKEMPKLKGTLKPTKVIPPKKRKIKRRTKEQMLVARHKEKKAELKKAVQKQKDFLNHNINKGK